MIDRKRLKSQNESLIREMGGRVNEHLPLLEEESELTPRSAADVARRLVVLTYVMGVGFGQVPEKMLATIKDLGLESELSKEERTLLACDVPTDEQLLNATWQYEGIAGLTWCLGKIDLDHTDRAGDEVAPHVPPPFSDATEFASSSKLRAFEDLCAMSDLHYRMRLEVKGRQLPLRRRRDRGATKGNRLDNRGRNGLG